MFNIRFFMVFLPSTSNSILVERGNWKRDSTPVFVESEFINMFDRDLALK